MNISKLISVFSLLLSIGFTRGYLRGSRALSSSGTTATIKLLGGNGVLRRNRKLRPIDIPLDFEIGLDIKPTTGIVQGWSNILHFTATNTNCCGYGSRIPGVWFRPGNRELFIADGHTANGKSHSGQWGCKDKVLKLVPGQNYRLKMVFKRKTVSVFVNDAVACNNIPRKDRKVFKNVQVYVADPWHEAAKASIKNLYFKALPAIEPCTCLAKYEPVCGKDGHTYSNACKAGCARVDHINGACQNPRRITCPVVGMLIKNGDLVPSIDSAGLPFITKKQTKLAMLKRGISMEIATKSTDGNFRSAACPTCPERINPFEMNIIKDGNSQDNTAGKPHEHFRSTGIRDNDAERPDKGLYAEAEERLFGGNKWMQWSPTMVRDLANLFNRSPDKCKQGVAKSTIKQHVLCSNDQADNIAPKTFAGSLQNMMKEFHDPSTGLITQDKFRAMWLKNEFPSYTTCEDQKLADGSAWFDARGPGFSCAWYAEDPDRCSTRGSERAGFTASTACCVCGSGADEELAFEPAPFRSLSIDEAEANKNQNAHCRDGFYKKYQTDELGGDVDSTHLSWPDADHSLDKCKQLCANEAQCKAISWCDNGDCCSLYNKACDHPWEGSNGHVSLRKKCD